MNVILAIAKTTVGEAVRRRVLLVILMIGVLFVAVAPGLSVLTARQNLTILTSFTLGVIQLTSAVIAVVLTVYLIPNEIERRTIYTIISKPVQRWQFLVGKFLGAVGALALMMALMTIVMVTMFFILGKGSGMDTVGGLVKVTGMYFVQMSLLAAVAIFFSTFVSPIVNFFLSGGVYLVGTFFNPLFDTFSKNDQLPALVKGAATLIHTVVPNFANYNEANGVINPGSVMQNETMYNVQLVAYALFYVLVFLIGGILVFDRREV